MKIVKKLLLKIYYKYHELIDDYRAKKTSDFLKKYKRKNEKVVFYLETPLHNNLGDLAQYYCIEKWIRDNLSEYDFLKFNAYDIVNKKSDFIEYLKKTYTHKDIIIFQSGYTTTDLGGVHDELHKLIFDNLDNPYVLMMPQTIFFKNNKRKEETSISYSRDKNLMFLARDEISFEMAKNMFNNISIVKYPDIVTSLIGTFSNSNGERNGIYVCCRNDSEKYYSDNEILNLIESLKKISYIEKGDTTIKMNPKYMRNNIEKVLYEHIQFFSKHKLIITDRYHGTIFSLVSNTPVIAIKTNDHKVVTGVDWFKGIYDDYVYYAETLDDAYKLAEKILSKEVQYQVPSYFKEAYYDKLLELFKEKTNYL